MLKENLKKNTNFEKFNTKQTELFELLILNKDTTNHKSCLLKKKKQFFIFSKDCLKVFEKIEEKKY